MTTAKGKFVSSRASALSVDSQPRGQESHLRISNCKCAGSTLKKEPAAQLPVCTVKFRLHVVNFQRDDYGYAGALPVSRDRGD
jgi:hypothetical protein